MVRATAGARPAAAVRRSGKRAAQRADPRATEARKQGPSARSGGQARRSAAPGGKGRPARAAGCGLLAYASRGHPCHFPGVVGWLVVGQVPAQQQKRPSPCGPGLFEWSLSRPLRRCIVIVSQFCAIVNPCCACRCRCCSGCCFGPSRGALPPWGGRGVGSLSVAAPCWVAAEKSPLTAGRACCSIVLSVALR